MIEDNNPLKTVIDWELEKKEFQESIRDMIKECMDKGKVLALPIELLPGTSFITQMALLLGQIDCTNCANKCCLSGENNIIDIMPKEYPILAEKFGARHFSTDGKGNHGIQFPCSFLQDHKCSIYGDRPLVCVLFPFQPGGYGGDDGQINTIAVASSCPEARRITRQVYMMSWRIRRQFKRATDFEIADRMEINESKSNNPL
jgi:Fe-S-cluster containining protein